MSDDFTTRQTLLKRARNQSDNDAWEEFAAVYKTFICHILQQMKVIDIEDLAQDVLLKLWKKLSSYDPAKARFRTWLSSVVRNIVLDHLRSYNSRCQREKKLVDEPSSYLNSSSSSEIEKLIEQEWKAHLSNLALTNLKKLFSETAMAVFKMSLESQTPDQISQKLNIKRESVKVLKSRVRTRYVEEVKRLIRNFEEL